MSVASIQLVRDVRPHSNADALDLCTILGWQVVIKKGEFKTGDKCVYVEIDSILPDKPEFEFLRNKNFRIKPIKLRGMESAGIVFPMSILPQSEYIVGQDVTELIDAKHYEKPIPAQLAGKIIGHRPSFIKKTDELNLRSYPHMLEDMQGLPYYITRKDDGSSGTFFIKDEIFGICSRNLQLMEDEKNGFWKMARKYDIEKHLREDFANVNTAIQAEIVGPGVNGNNLGLNELDLHAFSLIDITSGVLFPLGMLKMIFNLFNLPMVTVIEEGDSFHHTIESLLEIANGLKYPNGEPAEGIVIRPNNYVRYDKENVAWNALSGKILNENYKE